MEQKIYEYILKHNMVTQGDTVVVGLSGGADSVCLFIVLLNLSKKLGISLVAVHVNHGLRGKDADRDEEYCRYLCAKHKIPFEAFKADVNLIAKDEHMTCEEAGRKVRYEAFEKVRDRYAPAKIAVAHHMNDRAETVLFNMFRGSGISGLSGIKAVNGSIIRPLLCVNREEIEHFLRDNKILYMTDDTNFTDEYMRNKIRNHMLPYAVQNINENTISNINQAALICEQAEDYLRTQAKLSYENSVSEKNGGTFIGEGAFASQHDIIKQYVVRLVFEKMYGRLKDISFHHVLNVVKLFSMPVSKVINLPEGYVARREYDGVTVLGSDYTLPEIKKIEYESFVVPYEDMEWENSKIPKNDYTKYFDYDKIENHLELRTRQTGDYLVVDSKGSVKKLKDYFINEKVPAYMRDSVPLFADGSHIIWVVGKRISEYYKVTEETKRVIVVTVKTKE